MHACVCVAVCVCVCAFVCVWLCVCVCVWLCILCDILSSMQGLNAGPQGPVGYNGSTGPQGPRGEPGPEAVGGVINLNDYCRTEHWDCNIEGGSCGTASIVPPVSRHTLSSQPWRGEWERED